MTHTRRWIATGAIVALVVAGGAAAAYARAGAGGGAHHYRTTVARLGSVQETLSTTGTVDAKHRADVEFAISGKVAQVRARQGQRVAAGKVLAVLDRTTLRADLAQATATLARARAQLASDEVAQATTVSASAGGSGASTGATKPSPGTSKPRPTGGGTGGGNGGGNGGGTGVDTSAVKAALAQLAAQQQAVTTAQATADSAVTDAQDKLRAETTACQSALQTGADDQACQDALTAVQSAQALVQTDQQALSAALTTLAGTLDAAIKLLDGAVAAASGGGHTSSSAALEVSTGSSLTTAAVWTTSRATSALPVASVGTPTNGSATSASSGQTVTAARLASDQATIDTARAQVLTAQQALAQAVVRAPISGRVAELAVARGDTVSAGSTAAVLVDGSEIVVDALVSESHIRSIEVGQQVQVGTPGSATSSAGRVTGIGVTADSTSGTASYPVTITVRRPAAALPPGSSALVRIVLGTARNVVVVPTSAVSTLGGSSAVSILSATGTETRTPVVVGVAGGTATQIKSGLRAGQRVVLADLDQAVTGASTTLNNRGGFGAFRGGGGPPGGGFGSGFGGTRTRTAG